MKTRLIQIGNSRGIRIPKPIIEQAGLSEHLELRIVNGQVIIENVTEPRAGWAEAARKMRQRDEDQLVDEPSPTRFDDDEWEW